MTTPILLIILLSFGLLCMITAQLTINQRIARHIKHIDDKLSHIVFNNKSDDPKGKK